MEYKLPIGNPAEDAADNGTIGFVQRELVRLARALSEPQTDRDYCALYAAQQALQWALEPGGFMSPSEAVDRGLVLPLTPGAA